MEMEVDWPCTKRRRLGAVGPWWEAPEAIDEEVIALLLGLCDALALYASGAGQSGSSFPDEIATASDSPAQKSLGRILRGSADSMLAGAHFWAPGSPDSASGADVGAASSMNAAFAPGCGGRSGVAGKDPTIFNNTSQFSSPACTLTVAPLRVAPPSPSPERSVSGQAVHTSQHWSAVFGHAGRFGGCVGSSISVRSSVVGMGGTRCSSQERGGKGRCGSEPLLRTLTQLANAAAAGAAVRRQLVSECQVHAPLLRLMQGPWSHLPHVAERCCRLLHWLCARAPENREILAAHRSPCAFGGARSVSFVDAALGAAEAHPGCREVLAHALRALAALLPCPRAREELLRSQQRLLACLAHAGEALDASAVRAVCRWLPRGLQAATATSAATRGGSRGSILGTCAAVSATAVTGGARRVT
mmetsp:Transcript_42997/g.109299  ORF Transcript_42997/g.109299 Transcript_42997/m.109299 type:complete len:417 (-) Transcript_42997:7-1257(-)